MTEFASLDQPSDSPQVLGPEMTGIIEITYDFEPQNNFVHSEGSAFQMYKPTAIKRPSKKQKRVLPESVVRVVTVTSPVINDDLLTSEKTHFCPIKNAYNDGHTFSIDYSLDKVPFERSDTGSLYLNEKKFMNYKGGIRKYVLNHDYSDHEDSYYEEWEDKPRRLPTDGTFIIKFCCFSEYLSDKCCQTDLDPSFSFSLAAQDFHHYQKMKMDLMDPTGSFFTTTSRNDNGNGFESNNHLFLTSNSSSSSISTMTSLEQPHSLPVDTFDTWRPKNHENSNDGCVQHHSLWEHCESCEANDDGKSNTTAELMMRDELKMDGDEIMSDLKYIQNLYITGSCDEQDTIEEFLMEQEENEEDFNVDNKFYEHFYGIGKKYILGRASGGQQEIQIDEITFSKFQNTVNEAHPNFEKYLKLFQLIKASFLNDNDDINNNQDDNVDANFSLMKNRKRRHSTCQHFLEKKYFVHPGIPLFQNEQDACVYHPGADYWDINVNKIVMVNNEPYGVDCITQAQEHDPSNNVYKETNKDYYNKREAIIKYLDLARPLTR